MASPRDRWHWLRHRWSGWIPATFTIVAVTAAGSRVLRNHGLTQKRVCRTCGKVGLR